MFLAVDAGGTATRAAVLDPAGRCRGYGRAGSGNPTAVGVEAAVSAIGRASEDAFAGRQVGLGPASRTVIAMAGEQTAAFTELVTDRLVRLGSGPVLLRPDLLGIFGSGTPARDGYALIAGTGTVAARIVGGRLERVVGGRGWLLGDAGGGYWIGHRLVRAVVRDLDGQGEPTTLTPLVLAELGLGGDLAATPDRERLLRRLVSVLYAGRPVALSAFAPLAFAAPADPVALRILHAAAVALSDLVATVADPHRPGPLVVGGSVVVRGLLAAPASVRDRLVLPTGKSGPIPVADGVVGAAVLALRHAGVEVDHTLFQTLRAEVSRRSPERDTGPERQGSRPKVCRK